MKVKRGENMKYVEVQEIKNGFVLKVYRDYPSPAKLDYTIYKETFKEVLKELESWNKKR